MNGDISRLVELLSGYPNNVTVTAFDAETGAYEPLTGMIFNPQTMILELCTDSNTEQRTILREACKYSCGDFCLAESQQESITELEARLAAWEGQEVVTDTHALVPIEPTSDMIQAAYVPDGKYYTAIDIWKSMIKAAPTKEK